MDLNFDIELNSFDTIKELPNAWPNQSYSDLLDIMDFGDTSEITSVEIKEICFMSLAENEPEVSASIVLKYVFQDRLNKGQITTISEEIQEEKLWEEYADVQMHEELFNVNQLLYNAYNGKFPIPQAVKFALTITAKKSENLAVLKTLSEAELIKLITQGMQENTLIKRLYKKELGANASFKDASAILWQFKLREVNDSQAVLKVISSNYWFHDLKHTENFQAKLKY